jgi:hypothetical protein
MGEAAPQAAVAASHARQSRNALRARVISTCSLRP